MISSDQWRAYNDAVESIRSDAASEVERQISEWMASEWDGDPASAREEAKRIMASHVAEYDRRAASLAAAWYDARARESGAKLDRAVTAVTYTKHDIDALAHYQAGKLDGDVPDVDEFARMCGEFAANDAMKSVNKTILRNVKRDREKGAKFARVTSGRNTCAFCLMLAGRGAVYHNRKTAGEFDHWHRRCTCKVVPCFSGNRYEVLVEGHDPKKIEDRLAEIEERTGISRNTSAFNREVRLRDPDWLFGDEAATDYSLNPIEAYGTLVKPGDYSLENITNRGNEYRDLWAHHVLEDYGYKVTVRPPEALDALGRVIDGVTCPDLFIGDEIWEVKSPPAENRTRQAGKRAEVHQRADAKRGEELQEPVRRRAEGADGIGPAHPRRAECPVCRRGYRRLVRRVRVEAHGRDEAVQRPGSHGHRRRRQDRQIQEERLDDLSQT